LTVSRWGGVAADAAPKLSAPVRTASMPQPINQASGPARRGRRAASASSYSSREIRCSIVGMQVLSIVSFLFRSWCGKRPTAITGYRPRFAPTGSDLRAPPDRASPANEPPDPRDRRTGCPAHLSDPQAGRTIARGRGGCYATRLSWVGDPRPGAGCRAGRRRVPEQTRSAPPQAAWPRPLARACHHPTARCGSGSARRVCRRHAH
jgi:hypothetical protein